jgi:hypothetical protein
LHQQLMQKITPCGNLDKAHSSTVNSGVQVTNSTKHRARKPADSVSSACCSIQREKLSLNASNCQNIADIKLRQDLQSVMHSRRSRSLSPVPRRTRQVANKTDQTITGLIAESLTNNAKGDRKLDRSGERHGKSRSPGPESVRRRVNKKNLPVHRTNGCCPPPTPPRHIVKLVDVCSTVNSSRLVSTLDGLNLQDKPPGNITQLNNTAATRLVSHFVERSKSLDIAEYPLTRHMLKQPCSTLIEEEGGEGSLPNKKEKNTVPNCPKRPEQRSKSSLDAATVSIEIMSCAPKQPRSSISLKGSLPEKYLKLKSSKSTSPKLSSRGVSSVLLPRSAVTSSQDVTPRSSTSCPRPRGVSPVPRLTKPHKDLNTDRCDCNHPRNRGRHDPKHLAFPTRRVYAEIPTTAAGLPKKATLPQEHSKESPEAAEQQRAAEAAAALAYIRYLETPLTPHRTKKCISDT